NCAFIGGCAALTRGGFGVGCRTSRNAVESDRHRGERMTEPQLLMAGKRGLVMGVANDRSIAWGIATAVREQGAELAFTFQGEALEKRVRPLAESVGSELVLPCDVTDDDSIEVVFNTIEKQWGQLDFLV